MSPLARCSAASIVSLALTAGGTVAATDRTLAATVRVLPGTACVAFPANNVWHAPVADLPVNRRSAAWVRNIGSTNLHPDFGPSYGAQPAPYGIPITYVGGSHATVHVRFTYASESDHVGYPLGPDTKIEGGKGAEGDRHAIVVNRKTCRLYETWNTRKTGNGWKAGSGATWSLNHNKLRPAGWTSADAAGLPILPGLLRYDEVRAGLVDHAIRFTAPVTSRHYIWPARHAAGSQDSLAYPPMGARFRLKASWAPPSGFGKAARVVVRAMKTYGLILADNGSPWYFQGEASNKWPDAMISELKQIPGAAFEAVDESSLEGSATSARAG